jgi:signal transduction histidine kinase
MTTVIPTTRELDPLRRPPAVEEESRSHRGSLRSKLVLSLAGIFLVFLTIDELVRHQVIEPEFVALERVGAIRDANRVLAAMNAEVEHLSDLARQWAARIQADTTVGPTDSTAGSEQGSTDSSPRVAKNLDCVASIAQDGSWQWLYRSQPGGPLPVEDQMCALADACGRTGDATLSGMTRVGDHSLMMFAVVELSNSQLSAGVPRSTHRALFVAREIDEAMVNSLRRQTQVEFSLQAPQLNDSDEAIVVREADQSLLIVEVQLMGVHDQLLANVHIPVPRDITARSRRTTALARNSFVFGSVVALLMLLLLLQRIVISPLAAIRQHSNRVAEQGLETEPLVLSTNDEIGQLATAFDQMVLRLRDTQAQLTRASQATGRSQVASTVIHNVGNVLTNVNSLLQAATGRTLGLRIAPLDALASRLRQADMSEGLLAATPDYLEGLAGSLKSDREEIRVLLSTLHDNVRHIHDVIRAQQQHADVTVKPSAFKLKDVIDEAIACCQARLQQDSVEVTVAGRLSLELESDRSLLLQTIINIIGNARQAMRDSDAAGRLLEIDVERTDAMARIRFRDNGCGMSPETLGRLFEAHFTTRDGGSGLGLHFCAITLKRLGGSIHAASPGLGAGAEFTIELPLDGAATSRNKPKPVARVVACVGEGA